MLQSLVLILALCGDGGYKPQPIVVCFDHAIVQDMLDIDESLRNKQQVIQWRVIHLLNGYDDTGLVYEGWVLIKGDRFPQNNRYQFFQKFTMKWWELRFISVEQEVSNRCFKKMYPHASLLTILKEAGA